MKLGCSILICLTGVCAGQLQEQFDLRRSPSGSMEFVGRSLPDHHYILYRSLDLQDLGEPVDLVLSKAQETEVLLKDRFRRDPSQVYYRIQVAENQDAGDLDGDGVSDWAEGLANELNPWNSLAKPEQIEGTDVLAEQDFLAFSVSSENRAVTEDLSGERFMKFLGIVYEDRGPAILFMDTNKYPNHVRVMLAGRFDADDDFMGYLRGELAWVPNVGSEGVYAFNLQPGDGPSFEQIRMLYHLLTKTMPFIDRNLVYQPVDAALLLYHRDRDLYESEGIPVLLAEDRPNVRSYTPLNEGETFGFLRVLDADDRTSVQDVVIFRDLPNDVHLIQGIITETPQTPLSHVNLRAVQNQNPNAFIENASAHPDIAPLIGKFVRFAVTKEGFEIEEATRQQIDAHFATLRPEEMQFPERDLTKKEIISLEDAGFAAATFIGVKAANLSEMIRTYRTTRIDRDTFPALGYAIPFWFYDQYMTHNAFYEAARDMLDNPAFEEDTAARDNALKAFRKKIRGGKMPSWMTDALSSIQESFPAGQSIRCRSSTNNEDLPGFNGAGLYDSYTHHPDEGHLSKSVKQVFASLWRSLAFEHRDFYRVDHFSVAMGVLLHPNYDEEQVNGVAVSKYPLGGIAQSHYLNTQVGENLVTNPGASSRPEELLVSFSPAGISIVRLAISNQVPFGDSVLSNTDAQRVSEYLQKITQHFKNLYKGDEDFAIEIEFKITSEGDIAIKQARPWVN